MDAERINLIGTTLQDLQARTEIGAVGLAHSILSDRSGPVARGAQSLLVGPR